MLSSESLGGLVAAPALHQLVLETLSLTLTILRAAGFLNRILSGLVFPDFFSVVILLQWRRANLFITGCKAVLFEAKAILKPQLGILIECYREDSGPNCLRVPETFRIQSTRCVLAELLEKSHNGDPCVWLEIIEYESCPRQVWAYAGSAWLILSVNYIPLCFLF